MADQPPVSNRGPSRSAALVAACRMLAAELPEDERLINDPFAHLVVDNRAIAAAREDEHLQNVIRLRTRYIDDTVTSFIAAHAGHRPHVLLLGAGMDARAYRMDVDTLSPDAAFFEIDFPATLELKGELLAGHTPAVQRTVVPVDLAEREFVEPLIGAGYDTDRPAIVVWEGVIHYLGRSDRQIRGRADRACAVTRRAPRRRLRRDGVVQGLPVRTVDAHHLEERRRRR